MIVRINLQESVFTKGDFQVADALGMTNNMVPSAVTCLDMWQLPGWDRENLKCLELINSPNCNYVYKSDVEGMEMKSALRQLHLLCMKCLVISSPASPPTSWGLVLFSSHNSAAGLATRKTRHKPPKIHRRHSFQA